MSSEQMCVQVPPNMLKSQQQIFWQWYPDCCWKKQRKTLNGYFILPLCASQNKAVEHHTIR